MAPLTQGSREARCITSVARLYKNVTARRSHLNICPEGANISHARSAYFTAPKARFHTVSRAATPYFTVKSSPFLTKGAAFYKGGYFYFLFSIIFTRLALVLLSSRRRALSTASRVSSSIFLVDFITVRRFASLWLFISRTLFVWVSHITA